MKLCSSQNLLLLFLISILATPVFSQSSTEYDEWKKQIQGEFETYKDEIDKEFSQFLKKDWKKFNTVTGVIRDPVPKPVIIPQDKPVAVKSPRPVKPVDIPVVEPDPGISIEPFVKLKPISQEGEKVSLNFLGHDIDLFVKLGRKFKIDGNLNQQKLQAGFDTLAKSDYESLVQDLQNIRSTLRLNDWAYMRLIEKLSQSYVPRSQNSARLLNWFLLLKSKIRSRVAYADNELYLMVATKWPLFDITYFIFDNRKFYVISKHARINPRLYTYNGNYPKELALSDFSQIDKIVTQKGLTVRKLNFKYGRDSYELRIPYNKHVIDFFSSYPQMDIKHYFNVAINNQTKQSLLDQLRPLVTQLSQHEAVNFLLRFVQTGFEYKTDEQQFGSENYLFLEETIFYPSSDCEDRAILFSWLVDNLLGLEVVGLDFPGHVATAVELDEPVGSSIEHDGKIFTVADPTYINANLGRVMPQYKTVTPKVISFQ